MNCSDEKSRINYSVDNLSLAPRARASPRIDPRDCTKAFSRFILVSDPENWLRPDDDGRQGITYAKARDDGSRRKKFCLFVVGQKGDEEGADDIIIHVPAATYIGGIVSFLPVANETSSFFCA